MPPLSVLADALKKYPGWEPFLQQLGIADTLVQAVENGWSPAELQQHIEQTPYWKLTTGDARQWDLLQATDPASAQQKWDAGYAHLSDMRTKLGIGITEAEFQLLAKVAIQNNWSDQTVTKAMLGVDGGGHLPTGGDFGAAMTQVGGLANDYGVGTSARTQLDQAGALLTGGTDSAGLAEYYKNVALNQYGSNAALVGALNRGVTVKQYADPYIQMATNEVGVNPQDVALTDPKWNAFLTQTDPKTGAGMSLQQWQQTLRTDPRYGYNHTANAADQAAQLTSALAREFGATG